MLRFLDLLQMLLLVLSFTSPPSRTLHVYVSSIIHPRVPPPLRALLCS